MSNKSKNNQKTVKIPVEKKSTRWFRVMTTLHPYEVEGPHYLVETSDQWYCDNPKCRYTTHGKYDNYPLPCWRSVKLGADFVLCHRCVTDYSVTKQKHASTPSEINIILNVTNGGFPLNANNPIQTNVTYNSAINNNSTLPNVNVTTSYVAPNNFGINHNVNNTTTISNNSYVTPGNSMKFVKTSAETKLSEKKEKEKEIKPTITTTSGGEDNNIPQVLKQGWVLKQSSTMEQWNQRYCLLQNDGKMYCFENDKSKYYDEVLDFKNCQKIKCGNKCNFDVTTKESTWRFVCKTSEIRDEWVAFLCQITECVIE